MKNSFKLILASVMSLGMLLSTVPASASTSTPVIPNEPVVQQTYTSCIDGKLVVEDASILLPHVTNGRWINPDPTSEQTLLPSLTIKNVKPGEYTFNFTTAEGNFYIPEQPSNYLLINGVVSYTVSINGLPADDCAPVVTPPAPVVSDKSNLHKNIGKIAVTKKPIGKSIPTIPTLNR